MNRRVLLRLFSACFVVLSFSIISEAQTTIDPSLPSAPLSHKRVLFIFPGYETVGNPSITVPPLTSREKWQIFTGKVFDLSTPVEAVFLAGLSQSIHSSPHYGEGEAAYAERVGASIGGIASTSFFTDFALPVAFHQDPRYFPKGHGSAPSRIWYAVRRAVVISKDDGQTTFNSSGLLGYGLSTAISDAYYPRSSVTAGHTMQGFGAKIGIGALVNIVREFGSHP
jgi:hypothetical protein